MKQMGLSYKSFCWSLGTTSFRTKEFNLSIERQLGLLHAFNQKHRGKGGAWNEELQSAYYDYIKDAGFVEGEAKNKAKDAREKTSGLVEIGLIDDSRMLTEVGKKLLEVTSTGRFGKDNLLQIADDSFIYLQQLLKACKTVNGEVLRPYVVSIYLFCQLGYLTNDEFTFLLPLITNEKKLKDIVKHIQKIRAGETSIEEVIIAHLMEMDNYRDALAALIHHKKVTEELISEVGMNRKSRNYDKPYFVLYKSLWNVVKKPTEKNVIGLLEACGVLKIGLQWKQYLFAAVSNKAILKNPLSAINKSLPIFNAKTENEFKEQFFKLLHLFKAKETLADYFDLNRRYFKLTDCITFADGKVQLDTIPKCFFEIARKGFLGMMFTESNLLYKSCSLQDVSSEFNIQEVVLYRELEKRYGIKISSISEAKSFVEEQRYDRFKKMLKDKFSDECLIDLLNKFETRKDDDSIKKLVTSNADIPTIFEYIVGIIWYKLSNEQGKILEYMNLSLDADLLPKTHAAGGGEDITYQYEVTDSYPKHTLLIEVTLSEKNNQRRMEMEPVSRHLGDYLLNNKEESAYCVFISTYLHLNVVSDFRGRKLIPYYNSDGSECVEGMKIIPCQTRELKLIIQQGIKYDAIYRIFDSAFHANTLPNDWYINHIANTLA